MTCLSGGLQGRISPPDVAGGACLLYQSPAALYVTVQGHIQQAIKTKAVWTPQLIRYILPFTFAAAIAQAALTAMNTVLSLSDKPKACHPELQSLSSL